MVCLIQLSQLRVAYAADVTGFDLRGTHTKTVLKTKAKHVLTVTFSQKRPAPPTIDEIHSMM